MISRTCSGRVAFGPFADANPHVALAHLELRSYGVRMTEPPRPPGEGNPSDPTSPINPYSGNDPTPGSTPPPPAYGSPQPPTFDAPPPPTYGTGGYAPPPTSGAGAYGPPPGSPPYGYGMPAGGPGPVGFANNDEKTWALIAHFGGIVVGFIAPLVVLLAKGNESPIVRAHAVEALNFQITWGIATIIASILAVCTFGILFFLPIITWVVVIVFSIIAGMKANEGVLYHYPMTWRFVK
jgi:uncharacterized protein